jgi:hypothetical protein
MGGSHASRTLLCFGTGPESRDMLHAYDKTLTVDGRGLVCG